jgi:diguanylate cyclase (GGDEF)-like protein
MPKARVLAVDDQLYFRTFLEGLLAEEGYHVETAAGGAEALHALERERFDVVITDLVMPGMDGSELVRTVKERWPEQDVIVVSGVGDVQTAVGAMKYGATDYLLKPIERTALARALDGLLTARRLRREHEQLMRENLEYMGVLSLYERALGLFATLTLEPLAERVIETLCLETGAQSGVLWLRGDAPGGALELAVARGLVQVAEEPEQLDPEAAPPDRGGAKGSLVVRLRHAGRVLGVARLEDKLDGDGFGDRERAVAEKAAQVAAQALANALHVRGLERRSFRDPLTKAYTLAYFEDVVRNEIQKAGRFGRSFALLTLELEGIARVRARMSDPEYGRWLESVALQVGRALRSTDLVAAEGDGRHRVLLPETDALGAAVLKRRIREMLKTSEVLAPFGDEEPALRILLATVGFPGDGSSVEALHRLLADRLEEDRASLLSRLELEGDSFAGAVDVLLERAQPGHAATAEQVIRFAVDEVARRPKDRGLLFLAPGPSLPPPVRESLERLRGSTPRTEIVLVGDGKSDSLQGVPVTCVSARRAGTRAPFLVYCGDGPAYALLRERSERGSGAPPIFHTSDRSLVEHLAFQLQRDLGISLSAFA